MIPILRGEVHLGNNFVITTTKKGYPILIKKDDPIAGNQLRFSGSVRSDFEDIAFSLCKNDGITVEVGTHFGYRTIHYGKLVSEKGKVYAFEPNQVVFAKLRKTIFLNDLENVVELRDVSISNYKGTYSMVDCLTIKRMHDGSFTRPKNITVNCNTLDDEMMSEMNPISLLSINIPGSETRILQGAFDTINRSPDIAVVVAFDNRKSADSKDTEQVLRRFEENYFKFYVSDKDKTLKEVNLVELLKLKEAILVITKKSL